MFTSTNKKKRDAYVARALGKDSVICRRCRATLTSYGEKCTAALADPCEGFRAIDAARAAFKAQGKVKK